MEIIDIPADEVREGDHACIFDALELVVAVERHGGIVRITGERTSLSVAATAIVRVER